MKVENDGHLSLYVCDLVPERKDKLIPELDDFTPDAWVAAAYANKAGYRVYFVRVGQKSIRIHGNRYFVEKKVK